MTKKQKKNLMRILAAAAMMIVLHFVPADGIGRFLLYLIPYAIVGYDILLKAAKGIANGQVFDENFLMAVATLGALAIGLLKTGDYVEAIAVMLFYQIGELFQSVAVGRSRRNISELMDIRPDTANLEREDGTLETVDPDEIAVGSVIVVRPGEKVPIDGTVAEGESALDTAALTGESVPRTVRPGDAVTSGCVNMTGVLRIETTREFGESTVSKILDLVENASSRKSRSENFISKFARVYTPVVCAGALALAVLPPLVRLLFLGVSADWSDWIYRALTFLVISCPCALVVSIPLGFFAGIGGASREGVLVKGSNFLEALSKVRTVVFDKTGTLTRGVFKVIGIHHSPYDDGELLELASLAESASSHPIAVSIREAWTEKYGETLDPTRVREIRELGGEGVTAYVDGRPVACGNGKLMERLGVSWADCHDPGTIVHVAIDGAYAGHIVIADVVKPTAKEAIGALKRSGITRTVMLTGDRRAVAEKTAQELGIDEVKSELLPDEKVRAMEEILGTKLPGGTEETNAGQKAGGSRNDGAASPNGLVAFAGDGINDAPVLTRADVGIAMGALGADAAIEAADVVLMDDDPLKIAKAVRIARKVMRIVYENIVFAIGVKVVCLVLGALGIANMWLAIFADVGVMILAVLNAIRALFVRNV